MPLMQTRYTYSVSASTQAHCLARQRAFFDTIDRLGIECHPEYRRNLPQLAQMGNAYNRNPDKRKVQALAHPQKSRARRFVFFRPQQQKLVYGLFHSPTCLYSIITWLDRATLLQWGSKAQQYSPPSQRRVRDEKTSSHIHHNDHGFTSWAWCGLWGTSSDLRHTQHTA